MPSGDGVSFRDAAPCLKAMPSLGAVPSSTGIPPGYPPPGVPGVARISEMWVDFLSPEPSMGRNFAWETQNLNTYPHSVNPSSIFNQCLGVDSGGIQAPLSLHTPSNSFPHLPDSYNNLVYSTCRIRVPRGPHIQKSWNFEVLVPRIKNLISII